MRNNISLSPTTITLIYLIVAALWIAFTDRWIESLASDTQYLSLLQTYKGWFYVLLTSLGLFYLIKKHQQQLERKELKLENLLADIRSQKELKDVLFDRIPVLITIYDPDLKEFQVNKEFEKVIGWSNEEVKEKDIDLLEACYPNFELREEIVEFMNHPGVGWKEFPMTTKDGEEISTSWTNIRLTDNTSVGIGIDMTDIKASQAEVRESKELLEKVFESLKESVILVDPKDRKIADCNKSTERIFKYDRDELIGSTTKKLHISESKFQEFDELGKKDLEEKGVFQTEFVMQKKDGSHFYSDHTVTLVYDEEGEVDKVVSVVRDITDQKEHEKELIERNVFIEKTIENLPIGVAVNTIDDGKTTLMNKRFSEVYGWPEETLKDVDSFFESIYPDKKYREKNKTQVLNDIESGDPDRMKWEGISITTQNGTQKYVDAKTIPLYDQNLMISTVIDVTEQKNLEQKLRESEEKYRHLFENNPQPMWIYNPETLEFVEVNQAAINHYGYTNEEFLNMTLADIRPPEDIEAMKKDVEKHHGRKSYGEEWHHIKKDGTKINVEISADDVEYNEEHYRLVLVNDITERKRMQEKIIQSVIEGEDRERKRIAHELHDGLGQYLVAANMNFQSIEKAVKELPEKRREQFTTGLSLLKNALSETRSIAYNLMPKAISDYGLITALENLIETLKEGTGIDLHFNHNCEDLQLKNHAEINLYRIIQELVSNSVKHAKCSEISISLTLMQDSLKLLIEDNGIGTELGDYQEEKGLGLRSIKTRVNNLKGDLQMESESGQGLKTTIHIPRVSRLIINGDF